MTKTTCETVQPELKAYLDGMLPRLQAYRVRRHLATCESCKNELSEVEHIGKELHNMATEFSMDGDKLDPVLRARILAALPAEDSPTSTSVPVHGRYRLVMAIGAMASIAVVAAIILPQRLFQPKSLGLESRDQASISSGGATSASAEHKSWDSKAVAEAPAAAPASKAAAQAPNQAYLTEPESSMKTKTTSARPAFQDGHGAGGGGAPQVLDGIDAKAAAATVSNSESKDTGFTQGAFGGASAAPSAGGSSFSRGRNSGTLSLSKGIQSQSGRSPSRHAIEHEIHTFVASDLKQGEAQVRSAVTSFQGTVVGQPNNFDTNTVELTVSVSAERAEAFVAAIPALSGGALIAQPALVRAKTKSKKGLSQEGNHVYSPSNGDSIVADTLQTPSSSGGSGKVETRSGGEAHKKQAIGGRGAGKANASFGATVNGMPAMKTITIVLVKRK